MADGRAEQKKSSKLRSKQWKFAGGLKIGANRSGLQIAVTKLSLISTSIIDSKALIRID
jgi:hypothetical protein